LNRLAAQGLYNLTQGMMMQANALSLDPLQRAQMFWDGPGRLTLNTRKVW
jgi:hypothetical protein